MGKAYRMKVIVQAVLLLVIGLVGSYAMPGEEDEGAGAGAQSTREAWISSTQEPIHDSGVSDPLIKPLIDEVVEDLRVYLAEKRVLSLDGGGVRGAFTARILANLEEKTGKSIKDIFQGSITGTSTGSFLALAAVSPDKMKDGQKVAGPYTGKEMVEFYKERASHMFSGCWTPDNCWEPFKAACVPPTSWKRVVRGIFSCFGCFGCCYNCGGICGPQYSRSPLDREIQDLLGTTTELRKTLGNVQVITYDISRGGGVLHLSNTDPFTNGYYTCEAAAASSAPPTYYAAVTIGDGGERAHRRTCVDGGVFDNTPILAAVSQAKESMGDDVDVKDFTVVAVGTGKAANALHNEDLQRAGSLSWARPAIEIGMDGSSEATNLSFNRLYGGNNYFRVQGDLEPGLLDMDNPDNVEGLIKLADTLCVDPSSSYSRLVKKLEEEERFMAMLQTLYKSVDNAQLITDTFRRFKSLVGPTDKETRQNIERMLSESEEDRAFARQVHQYFNNPALLRALRSVVVDMLQNLVQPL